MAQVAGMEPAVVQYLGGGLRGVEGSGEEARAFHQDFVVLGNLHFHPGQGQADAAGLGPVERVECDHAALGEPVAFDDGQADGFVELGEVLA